MAYLQEIDDLERQAERGVAEVDEARVRPDEVLQLHRLLQALGSKGVEKRVKQPGLVHGHTGREHNEEDDPDRPATAHMKGVKGGEGGVGG